MPKGDENDFGDLTNTDIQKIMVDYMMGRPQRVTGKDAEKFLEKFKKDVAEIEKKGGKVDISF